MIKYCCDICKEDIDNNEIIRTKVPLPQYAWARGGIKDVKIAPFLQGFLMRM